MCMLYIKSHGRTVTVNLKKKVLHPFPLPFWSSAQNNLVFRLDVSIQQRISPPLIRAQTILSGLLPSSPDC